LKVIVARRKCEREKEKLSVPLETMMMMKRNILDINFISFSFTLSLSFILMPLDIQSRGKLEVQSVLLDSDISRYED
jgi:hypothetical protein